MGWCQKCIAVDRVSDIVAAKAELQVYDWLGHCLQGPLLLWLRVIRSLLSQHMSLMRMLWEACSENTTHLQHAVTTAITLAWLPK